MLSARGVTFEAKPHLIAKMPDHDREMNPATNEARAKLDRWQTGKRNDSAGSA